MLEMPGLADSWNCIRRRIIGHDRRRCGRSCRRHLGRQLPVKVACCSTPPARRSASASTCRRRWKRLRHRGELEGRRRFHTTAETGRHRPRPQQHIRRPGSVGNRWTNHMTWRPATGRGTPEAVRRTLDMRRRTADRPQLKAPTQSCDELDGRIDHHNAPPNWRPQ